MSVERALSVARDQGADPERIRIGREVDVVPEAPSHVWVIFPSAGGAVVVGGMDRGAFTAYARFDCAASRSTTAPHRPRRGDDAITP